MVSEPVADGMGQPEEAERKQDGQQQVLAQQRQYPLRAKAPVRDEQQQPEHAEAAASPQSPNELDVIVAQITAHSARPKGELAFDQYAHARPRWKHPLQQYKQGIEESEDRLDGER